MQEVRECRSSKIEHDRRILTMLVDTQAFVRNEQQRAMEVAIEKAEGGREIQVDGYENRTVASLI